MKKKSTLFLALQTFGQGTDSDSDMLASTTSGLWDVTVDTADNILFNVNGSPAFIGIVESGKTYTPGGYDVLATGDPEGWGNWLTVMDATGNVLNGGKAYTGDFYNMPLGWVSAVPEPSAILLLATAGLTAMFYAVARRRKQDAYAPRLHAAALSGLFFRSFRESK